MWLRNPEPTAVKDVSLRVSVEELKHVLGYAIRNTLSRNEVAV